MMFQAIARPQALALAAALLAAGAMAQTAPKQMTDAAPPPAEERNSTGAVVLEASPVRALQNRFATNPAAVMGAAPAPVRRAARAERDAEEEQLRRLGAGSLTEK
ncbi:MAG: hypothetical protein HYX47_05560 [Burkholderiales bacterium]|nr:hypothetical protein [Burkholderiales bacterium]